MQQNGFYDQGLVYAIYGMTVAELGDTRQAASLFRKGLEMAETNQPSTQVFLLYGYAHTLSREGQYDEAITLLQQALALTDEKKHVLFQNLEHCMTDQGIYRDKLLTKEKVADLLGTNRTYLSQVINEQTGQTFTQYVNRYRLDEAIRLLGDPQADITLKGIASDVGFSSMTTSTKCFRPTSACRPRNTGRRRSISLPARTRPIDFLPTHSNCTDDSRTGDGL